MTDKPIMHLLPVTVLADVAGERCALTEHAVVAAVTADPADAGRILVLVVDGGRTGLRDGASVTARSADLLSLAEARELLAHRSGADRAATG